MGPEYFDRQGRPLDLMSWAQIQQDLDYRRVGKATVPVDGSDVEVSTVWIGLDHSFWPTVRHTYETMLFTDYPRLDNECWRWCCEEHALAGHMTVVAYLLREGPEPEGCRHLPPPVPADSVVDREADSK